MYLNKFNTYIYISSYNLMYINIFYRKTKMYEFFIEQIYIIKSYKIKNYIKNKIFNSKKQIIIKNKNIKKLFIINIFIKFKVLMYVYIALHKYTRIHISIRDFKKS